MFELMESKRGRESGRQKEKRAIKVKFSFFQLYFLVRTENNTENKKIIYGMHLRESHLII